MQLKLIKLIYLKEILDLLRDRRTIISMLVFPMLFIPLIFLGLNYFLSRTINRAQDKQFNLALKQERVKNELQRAGVPERILTPFTVEKVNTAPPKKMSGMFIGAMIGYMFVMFMLMGAMYPAIDMTAGEKERRTMEMLLSAPAGRGEIVLGKILVAITASFMTSVLTIISFRVSSLFGMKATGSGRQLPFIMEIPLDAKTFALIFVSIIPMAIL